MSSLQSILDRQQEAIAQLDRPLLATLAELHGLTIRDFSRIFGIGKNHAEKILKHRAMPSLELALRISRYYEVTVEDLFGYRVPDDGSRRPLIVQLRGIKGGMRIGVRTGAMRLMELWSKSVRSAGGFERMADMLRKGKVK